MKKSKLFSILAIIGYVAISAFGVLAMTNVLQLYDLSLGVLIVVLIIKPLVVLMGLTFVIVSAINVILIAMSFFMQIRKINTIILTFDMVLLALSALLAIILLDQYISTSATGVGIGFYPTYTVVIVTIAPLVALALLMLNIRRLAIFDRQTKNVIKVEVNNE